MYECTYIHVNTYINGTSILFSVSAYFAASFWWKQSDIDKSNAAYFNETKAMKIDIDEKSIFHQIWVEGKKLDTIWYICNN